MLMAEVVVGLRASRALDVPSDEVDYVKRDGCRRSLKTRIEEVIVEVGNVGVKRNL
jgi:hypothetical protein